MNQRRFVAAALFLFCFLHVFLIKLATRQEKGVPDWLRIRNVPNTFPSCWETSPLGDQLCILGGKLYGCTLVPGRLVYTPNVRAPTHHCLNASMAWGPCREGKFLCSNFSEVLMRCRELKNSLASGLALSDWREADCDFLAAGYPRKEQIEKVEALSQPEFVKRSQAMHLADGDLLIVSAASDPASPFDSFMMSAGIATKLMLGYNTHHIRIQDFSLYQKPRQLLEFLERRDVSDSSIIWFQDAFDTFMIRSITASRIQSLALFDPASEVLFNGECNCHGEQSLCPLQRELFGSKGPWHFLNSGQFLGQARILKRFLAGLSETILGHEEHWDRTGGDQGAFMEFCFGASQNSAASLGVRCIVDSASTLFLAMKSCEGVRNLEIPGNMGDCKGARGSMPGGTIKCLTDPVSQNQPIGIHFNGKTHFHEAEVEIVKPFLLMGIDNADMESARSCLHTYSNGGHYQGCIKFAHLVEQDFLQVFNGQWDLDYPLLLEPLSLESEQTSCSVNGQIYTCIADNGPGHVCLGNSYSWGVCTGGKDLCRDGRSQTSSQYRRIRRLGVSEIFLKKLVTSSKQKPPANEVPVCFVQGGTLPFDGRMYRYECTKSGVASSVECLEAANHRAWCGPEEDLLCSDKSIQLPQPRSCEKMLNEILGADALISHHCIENSCAFKDLVFRNIWKNQICEGKLCFGCRLMLNNEGCWTCANSDYRNFLPSTKNVTFLPDSGSKLNELRVGHQSQPIQIFAAENVPQCDIEENRTAILIWFDGWNPFHQAFITFRPMFEALQNYQALQLSSFHKINGNPFECVAVVVDIHEQRAESEMGALILQSLCPAGVIVLSSLGERSICFSNLILLSSTGFDAPFNDIVPSRVIHSGIILASRLKTSWHLAPERVFERSIDNQLTVLLRKGRREIANEKEVLESIREERGGNVFLLNLISLEGTHQTTLRESLDVISSSLGMVGVHGAGLTNAMFLPPVSVLIEIRVGYARAPFRQLCKQFGIAYLEFPRTFVTESGITWPIRDDRDRKVVVDDVKGLASLVSFGVKTVVRLRSALSG